MRRGAGTDLLLAALVLSALVHAGLMVSVRSHVMMRALPAVVSASHRGPMHVTKAKTRPDLVAAEVLPDRAPAKEAPEATETAAQVPAVANELPVAAETDEASAFRDPVRAELPPLTEELPVTLVSPPHAGTATDWSEIASKPADVRPASVTDQPLASSGAFAAPTFASTSFGETIAAAKIPESEEKVERGREDSQTFEPIAEVMNEVDERIVASEKEAVRALVDVTDARDLTQAVSVSARFSDVGEKTYFRVTLTPKETLKTVPKDVVILIDASGSIGKDRMGSIRGAAKKILRSASNTGDRFNLVAFRDRFSYAFRTWQTCTAQSFEAADRWLNTVAPFGRTDIFSSIASVLTLPRDPSRPLIALVVTDGEANAGVCKTPEILSKFTALNDGLISIYMYGVKSSANRELIDVLTRGNRGDSFVFEGWRWKAGEGIEPLSEKFRDPLLSDLRVVFASGCPAEAYPRLLKNLSRGEKVEFTGALPRGTKELAFSLKGLNGQTAYEAFFRLPIFATPNDSALHLDFLRERSLYQKLH